MAKTARSTVVLSSFDVGDLTHCHCSNISTAVEDKKKTRDFVERFQLLIIIIISSCMKTRSQAIFYSALWLILMLFSQLKAGPTWSCARSSSSRREPLRWWRASATEAADPGRRPEGRLPTDPPPVRAVRPLQTQRWSPRRRWAAPPWRPPPWPPLPSRSFISPTTTTTTTDFHFVDLPQFISFNYSFSLQWFL